MEGKQPSSFRDHAGFVFYLENRLYREINMSYLEDYAFLMQSGLYDKLVEENLLISHQEVKNIQGLNHHSKIIEPEIVNFISYPYEWSFSQIKDAALLTLQIQGWALQYGMILKDASAYNVQFHHGKSIFIDTLSFNRYQEGSPWQAYHQFCKNFLAPLMLIAYNDVRLNQLSKTYIDGFPLDLVSKLLPYKTYLKLSSLLHIHIHSRIERKSEFNNNKKSTQHKCFTKQTLQHLNQQLISIIQSLKWRSCYKKSTLTEHLIVDYDNLERKADAKEKIIKWLEVIKPETAWELGANEGKFSLFIKKYCSQTVVWDPDANCIEDLYIKFRDTYTKILPLIIDIANPTPSIGWENEERFSFQERGPVNVSFALNLILYLMISCNIPLKNIAQFFSKFSNYLIIDFASAKNIYGENLLLQQKEFFKNYTLDYFEKTFSEYFEKIDTSVIVKEKECCFFIKTLRLRSIILSKI